MNAAYSFVVFLTQFLLNGIAFFNKKIKLFTEGRKETFSKISNKIKSTDKVIWIHCASLGEFEQGRPIVEQLKSELPLHKIVITFFSPSGYEVRKNYNLATVVCYLPLDSPKNAHRFLDLVNPELAIFVKYEFWPNILSELKNRNIKTVLVSAIFRKNQIFFKWYGKWMRNSLKSVSHFFVQDQNSEKLLKSIGFSNVTISGDTRFDRVFEISNQNNELPFIAEFKNNCYTVVVGSSWKEDEELLVQYINQASENEKFVIAPHNIHAAEIENLKKSIAKKTVLFSEKEDKNLNEFQVFIIDTVGILTKIYSYADVAYVGGGYTKSGVHNVLEPASFGVPIIIGPNYKKFKEAIDLVKIRACFSVNNFENLSVLLTTYFTNEKLRIETGKKSLQFVKNKIGATDKIINYLKK